MTEIVSAEPVLNRGLLCSLLEANTNHDNPGLGLDFYRPEQEFGYPEAYANLGRAAFVLGETDLAQRCVDFLGSDVCWGLPWPWRLYGETEPVPANTGFVTTTVSCLAFLEQFGLADYSWLVEHAWVYGEHETAQIRVYNSWAQAACCLAKENSGLAKELLKETSEGVWNGLYAYSPDKPFAFEQHQAMVHEGFISNEIDQIVELDATWRVFFSNSG